MAVAAWRVSGSDCSQSSTGGLAGSNAPSSALACRSHPHLGHFVLAGTADLRLGSLGRPLVGVRLN